ncbi:Rpn family recombination-promoting nuclease/putative transposase [Blautia sp.]|uniref:Rpn family recombination-promoting nuclease/putative transposase n=1 Tax=Blautia sp. TaxID=1955243 RepID=UPI00258800E2|nr:Rpn family recombination-promoting nuclease/putative transposase [Blautia sp.]
METDNFIMLPTVDFCFAELMKNDKVRKGFIAALLGVSPEEVEDTMMLSVALGGNWPDDKLGILDVHVLLADGTRMNMEMQVKYFECWDERVLFYMGRMFAGQIKKGEPYEKLQKCIHVSILDFVHFPDDVQCYRTIHFRDDKTGNVYSDKMEIQILELKKLPKEVRTGEDVILWMKFFSGKSREEFESVAKANEYLNEAYHTLRTMSADEKKRMEYEARDKALRDYNSQISSAERRGKEEGERQTRQVFKLYIQGETQENIAKICGMTLEKVKEILQ